MIHTQYGLRPSAYYDKDDYPLPVIKSEATLNERDTCFGLHIGEVTHFYIFNNDRMYRGKCGSHGYNGVAKIAHRKGGMYLNFTDVMECNLKHVKKSITMRMNKRPENDMTIDELIIEYGHIE